MDLISSNSANTNDKTLNSVFNLYSAYKNDSITINFGDSMSQTLLLNSSNFLSNNFKIIYLFCNNFINIIDFVIQFFFSNI